IQLETSLFISSSLAGVARTMMAMSCEPSPLKSPTSTLSCCGASSSTAPLKICATLFATSVACGGAGMGVVACTGVGIVGVGELAGADCDGVGAGAGAVSVCSRVPLQAQSRNVAAMIVTRQLAWARKTCGCGLRMLLISVCCVLGINSKA